MNKRIEAEFEDVKALLFMIAALVAPNAFASVVFSVASVLCLIAAVLCRKTADLKGE